MKFLCVKCDEPMKLTKTAPPDRGSLTIIYSCPECDHQIAMLTNPYETQVVQSLGIKIGPKDDAEASTGDLSKCPFSEMVQEMTGTEVQTEFSWTAQAEGRLENIPEFVRPMARTGIEKFARDHGYPQVNEAVLDEAKDFFGM